MDYPDCGFYVYAVTPRQLVGCTHAYPVTRCLLRLRTLPLWIRVYTVTRCGRCPHPHRARLRSQLRTRLLDTCTRLRGCRLVWLRSGLILRADYALRYTVSSRIPAHGWEFHTILLRVCPPALHTFSCTRYTARLLVGCCRAVCCARVTRIHVRRLRLPHGTHARLHPSSQFTGCGLPHTRSTPHAVGLPARVWTRLRAADTHAYTHVTTRGYATADYTTHTFAGWLPCAHPLPVCWTHTFTQFLRPTR